MQLGLILTTKTDHLFSSFGLIAHTITPTTLVNYKVGTHVNLEIDLITRYLERLMLGDKASVSN